MRPPKPVLPLNAFRTSISRIPFVSSPFELVTLMLLVWGI